MTKLFCLAKFGSAGTVFSTALAMRDPVQSAEISLEELKTIVPVASGDKHAFKVLSAAEIE